LNAVNLGAQEKIKRSLKVSFAWNCFREGSYGHWR